LLLRAANAPALDAIPITGFDVSDKRLLTFVVSTFQDTTVPSLLRAANALAVAAI
jgi:hypothetical protein